MKRFLAVVFWLTCLCGAVWAANAVPFVNQPLVPTATAPGGSAFTLTVNGSGFVSGAIINWNGQALATTFVSGSRLTALVPATDIASPSTASITVANPGVGAASNVVYFQVTNPESNVYYEDPSGEPTFLKFNGSTALATAVAIGDFANNGKQDLALGVQTGDGANDLIDLLSNGDGTFAPAVSGTLLPDGTNALAVGDFTGNGRLDLVANASNGLGSCANTVSVLLNNGDGTFATAPGSPVTVGPCPSAIAVGDFNRDGNLDLAVASGPLDVSNGGSVTILLGNGDGTFTPAPGSPISGLYSPASVVAGDFDGDGKLDLAVNDFGGTLWVFLGNGDGTFTSAPGSPLIVPSLFSFGLVAADFNGDGKLDLAEASSGITHTGKNFGNAVNILLGNGDGTFTPIQGCCGYSEVGTFTEGLLSGDFNGDGKLDLAVVSYLGGPFLQILLGNSDGTFTPTDYAQPAFGPSIVGTADFNNDGKLDFFVAFEGGLSSTFLQVNPTWPTPPDFTITAQNSPLSVQQGGTVTDNLTISSQNGFYGPVTTNCSGAPALATCTVSPASELAYPPVPLLLTLTITTTAPTTTSLLPRTKRGAPSWPAWLIVLAALLASTVLVWFTLTRPGRRYAPAALVAIALMCLGVWSSCGTTPPSTQPLLIGGTPAGTYTITVTATSPSGGGLTHSIPIALTVQ
jgi:hypothetical protein